MRRREFNASLLIAVTAIQPLVAQAPTKQPRIAIVVAEGKPENISEAGSVFCRTFFAELRREFSEPQLVELASAIAWENHRARFNRTFGIGSEGFSEGDFCPMPESSSLAGEASPSHR